MGTRPTKNNTPATVSLVSVSTLVSQLESLTVTQGSLAGQPFEVLPWQRRFVRGAFRPGVVRAALTCARGNGKSGLIAGLAVLFLLEPLARPRGEVVVLASSFGQARAAIGEQAIYYLGGIDNLRKKGCRVQDSNNHFAITTPAGQRLSVMAADSRRAHGRPGIICAMLDEPAQWPPGIGEKLLAAITTSAGKQAGFKMIAIGTRSASPEHWFSRWLDGGADYVQRHEARDDLSPFTKRQYRRANPSYNHFPDLAQAVEDEAKRARRDVAELAAFKALRLNLGVEEVGRQSLLQAGTWESCETETLPDADGPLVWGIDLGATSAMSALSAYWPQSGRLESMAAFPSIPSLSTRGASDHVGGLYQRMADRGELIQAGGNSVDVSDLLREGVRRYGPPDIVVADRWREGELRDALEHAGVPVSAFSARGMGFKDGAEDVRGFRKAAIEGRIKAKPSLLLRSALSQAVTVSDPAGNAKLAKGSQGGRRQDHKDDAAAATILAVAAGTRLDLQERQDVVLGYV